MGAECRGGRGHYHGHHVWRAWPQSWVDLGVGLGLSEGSRWSGLVLCGDLGLAWPRRASEGALGVR